jgi:hypothetical protein
MTGKIVIALIIAAAVVVSSWIMKPPRYRLHMASDRPTYVIDTEQGKVWLVFQGQMQLLPRIGKGNN